MSRHFPICLAVTVALVARVGVCAGSAAPATELPQACESSPEVRSPILFEGFGLEEFEGAGSIASALRQSDVRPPAESIPLDLRVRGPSSQETLQAPMVAEIRSKLVGFHVSAGVQADRWVLAEGPTRLLGSVGFAANHDRGRESVELRTAVGQGDRSPRLSVEVGPRIERRLRRGMLFFLDGKAEAQSLRADQQPTGTLPSPTFDGVGTIGLTGRAGLLR
jgi:hypothetical protein